MGTASASALWVSSSSAWRDEKIVSWLAGWCCWILEGDGRGHCGELSGILGPGPICWWIPVRSLCPFLCQLSVLSCLPWACWRGNRNQEACFPTFSIPVAYSVSWHSAWNLVCFYNVYRRWLKWVGFERDFWHLRSLVILSMWRAEVWTSWRVTQSRAGSAMYPVGLAETCMEHR